MNGVFFCGEIFLRIDMNRQDRLIWTKPVYQPSMYHLFNLMGKDSQSKRS